MLHGLVATISEWPELQVIGRATSIDALALDPAAALADVLVLDVDILEGEVLGPLAAGGSVSVVLLKSARDQSWSALDAITALGRLDGLAIVDKDGSGEQLREAIRLVQRGAFFCEMASIRSAVRRLATMSRFADETPIEALSQREADVLELVARGLSNKEIGTRLSVSEGTVKSHVSHIMAKLRLANRSQVVAYAMATGTAASLARDSAAR
jgi:DNA-binding NarL/FixJ family response regulator